MTTRGRSFPVAVLVTLAAVVRGPAASPPSIVRGVDAVGYGELSCSVAKIDQADASARKAAPAEWRK